MVGTGGVSRAHRRAFLAAPDVLRLVAACDTAPGAAEAYVEELPYPAEALTRYQDLLDRPDVDAAVIALPHHLHFTVARDFVQAGMPVLVEKPLTCTLDETRQLRDLAAERGVPVVAGQMHRHNPEAMWLRDWARAAPRNFGELRSFEINSYQNVLGYVANRPGHWILDAKLAGGGVVISLAIHQLDLLRFISGHDYVEVTARGRFDPPFNNGAESDAVALLRLSNGASGVLHASYTAPRVPYNESMALFGEYGSIVQHAEGYGQYKGPLRYASVRDRQTVRWGDQYEGFERVPASEASAPSDDPFINQLVHFALALHEGATPMNHVDENFNTMACVQAIRDSLRSGKTERVATE
jgi:predicted dehydrogenase